MNNMEISVIIPAYNEVHRLPPYLDEWLTFLSEHYQNYEVIVVDDGSTDGTVQLVKAHPSYGATLRVVEQPRAGKGAAVRRGMFEAQGALRIFADADGATPARELLRLTPLVEGKDDAIAIGSRIALAGTTTIERRLTRHYMGRIFATITSLITRLSVYDTQCGFKLFTAHTADTIFPTVKTNGFAFDIEVLMRARRRGVPVYEVPISWRDVPGSKVRVFRDAYRMVIDSIRIRRMVRKDS